MEALQIVPTNKLRKVFEEPLQIAKEERKTANSSLLSHPLPGSYPVGPCSIKVLTC